MIQQICMADDDPDDYLLFSTTLKEINDLVQILWFTRGKELLDYLATNIDPPDLIILDMNMPGNNGHECLQMIKGDIRFSDVPVVMFSTACSPEVVKNVFESGASQFFKKPHSIEGYTKVIEEMLAIPKYIFKK